jgi:putative PEP-CTERM system TPR-repeat lipoprotein
MDRFERLALVAAIAAACALPLAGCGSASEQQSIAAAKASIEKRDLKSAMIRLKATLNDHPGSAEARFLLGKTLLEAGDPVAAELELRKAKELSYPAEQWAPLLAKALLLRYQFKPLIEELGTLQLPNAAAQADLNASLAAAMAVDGQRERASALVESTLLAAPQHAPTLMLKARMLARPGSLEAAINLIDSVLAREPANFEAWQLLGDLRLYGSRDLVKASAAYDRVLSLRPVDLAAHSALIFIALVGSDLDAARKQLGLMSKALPGHPQTKFLSARVAFLGGDSAQARDLIQQLLRLAPSNVALLEFAGAVELKLNSPLQAEPYLQKALAQTPDLPPVRRLLAEAYLRGGKPLKALEVLRPNVERAAPDAMSLNLAAEAHLLTGDIKKAESFFKQASKLAPNDPKYKTALALTLLAKGQAELAFSELRAIAAAGPDTLPDLTLISALLRRQKLDEALLAIDGLERKQPDKPTAANLRGRVQLARRDLAGARKSFEQALTKDPVFLPAIASLATIDIAEGKPGEAEKRYEAVVKLDPKNSLAYLALAQLKARSGGSKDEIGQLLDKAIQANPVNPTARLARIQQWISLRDMKSAMAAAQAGVAAMPENPDMLDALGSMQLVTGESNQAIASFNKLATMQPSVVKFQLRMADAYLQGKDYAGAERSFKRALDISPTELSAQRGLIALSVRAKQPERALTVARNLQRQRPDDSIGFLIEGDIHREFKDQDAAIKAYRMGLDRPKIGRLPESLYSVLATAKGQPEADRFGEDWVKSHPKGTDFQIFLGNNALAGNDLPKAERYFADIVRANPKNVFAMNNLAWALAKQGKPGAVAMAEKAVAMVPDNAAVLDTLAFALAADNQLGKAIETAKAVLVLAPSEPVYRLNLARFYVRAGEKANAKAELEQLIPLGTKFARQSEVGELLKSL